MHNEHKCTNYRQEHQANQDMGRTHKMSNITTINISSNMNSRKNINIINNINIRKTINIRETINKIKKQDKTEQADTAYNT